MNDCDPLIDLSSFIFALSSFICCWTDRTIETLIARTCKYYSFYHHLMGRFSSWNMSLTSVKIVKSAEYTLIYIFRVTSVIAVWNLKVYNLCFILWWQLWCWIDITECPENFTVFSQILLTALYGTFHKEKLDYEIFNQIEEMPHE